MSPSLRKIPIGHKPASTLTIAIVCLVLSGAAPAVEEKTATNLTPTMQGKLPRLNGTAWKVTAIYNQGEKPKRYTAVPTMIFCKSGRWEFFINPSRPQIGTYSTSKDELTTNGAGTVGRYQMAWDAEEKQLGLEEKGIIMRLEYRGETKC
jgi:hypothetical protein